MASVPPADPDSRPDSGPDPRTAADDDEDATFGEGVSGTDPAEGDDDEPGEQDGSPQSWRCG